MLQKKQNPAFYNSINQKMNEFQYGKQPMPSAQNQLWTA